MALWHEVQAVNLGVVGLCNGVWGCAIWTKWMAVKVHLFVSCVCCVVIDVVFVSCVYYSMRFFLKRHDHWLFTPEQ